MAPGKIKRCYQKPDSLTGYRIGTKYWTEYCKFKQPVDNIERMTYRGAENVENFRKILPKIKSEDEHEIWWVQPMAKVSPSHKEN